MDLRGPHPPDMQTVSTNSQEAVVRVVDLPFGKRPFRSSASSPANEWRRSHPAVLPTVSVR